MGVFTLSELQAVVAERRASGARIVFTNGVFDLLHPGHVRYLQQARRLGDFLVIGVNSDRSVRVNKGESRPITPENERAEVLAALECVDAVVIFDQETPHDLIAAVAPDVLVKGADYREDQVVGGDFVKSYGGRIALIDLVEGKSTTGTIAKLRAPAKV